MKDRLEKEDPMESVAEEAAEAVKGAKRRLYEAYDRTSSAANRMARDAADYGRNNPFLTSLVVFGAGVGVGCLIAAERRPRYSRRLVPALAGAVAHAVREALDARR
jgi:ElaB/YqjD/DUF883 family membrane-anchored ribosome-binding protein